METARVLLLEEILKLAWMSHEMVVCGDLDAGAASCQKVPQFSVVDNIDGPVVFRYPSDKMCATLNH
jgi:hypothetical protein